MKNIENTEGCGCRVTLLWKQLKSIKVKKVKSKLEDGRLLQQVRNLLRQEGGGQDRQRQHPQAQQAGAQDLIYRRKGKHSHQKV